MERHFVDHIEAFGNGYADPQRVSGAMLPEDEIIAPHECLPGICDSTETSSGETEN